MEAMPAAMRERMAKMMDRHYDARFQ